MLLTLPSYCQQWLSVFGSSVNGQSLSGTPNMLCQCWWWWFGSIGGPLSTVPKGRLSQINWWNNIDWTVIFKVLGWEINEDAIFQRSFIWYSNQVVSRVAKKIKCEINFSTKEVLNKVTTDHNACCSVNFLFVLVWEGTVALLPLPRSDRVFST